MAKSILPNVKRFAREERGASFVEYAVLVGIVAIGCIAFMGTFRGQIQTAFTNMGNSLVTNTPAK
jgi:pilus assembly protein Flp/PilA